MMSDGTRRVKSQICFGDWWLPFEQSAERGERKLENRLTGYAAQSQA